MILIINGTIYPMSSPPIKDGALLTEGRYIKTLYKSMDEVPKFDKDLTILDAKGGWILPGLIESHCHVGITEERIGKCGEDGNELVNPITPYLSALDAVNPMDSAFSDAVKAGITSVLTGPGSSNVVGGQFIFMKTYGKIIDDMVRIAPAAMKVAFGENPKRRYEELDRSPVSRMGIASMLREELYKAKSYKEKKEYFDKKHEYFERVFHYESWLPVLERKIPLKAHVHRADDIMTAIRIAKEYGLTLTLDHATEGHLIAERLAKEGYPVIVGPNPTFKNKLELENLSADSANILYRAGLCIAFTTDHPVNLIQSLPICAGLAVKAGLPLEEGLRGITSNAAKICNAQHMVGSLSEGLYADIAVFDGNPMETFTNTLYTIIDGDVVYDYESVQTRYNN